MKYILFESFSIEKPTAIRASSEEYLVEEAKKSVVPQQLTQDHFREWNERATQTMNTIGNKIDSVGKVAGKIKDYVFQQTKKFIDSYEIEKYLNSEKPLEVTEQTFSKLLTDMGLSNDTPIFEIKAHEDTIPSNKRKGLSKNDTAVTHIESYVYSKSLGEGQTIVCAQYKVVKYEGNSKYRSQHNHIKPKSDITVSERYVVKFCSTPLSFSSFMSRLRNLVHHRGLNNNNHDRNEVVEA